MSYKLLALDIDGTLVDKNIEVHQSTIALLKLLTDKGIIVTLATGRMYPSAKAIAAMLNIIHPLIVYNGAQIRDTQNDGYIFSEYLPLDTAKHIINFCKENNLYLQFYENDVIIVEKLADETRIDPDLAFSSYKEVGDFTSYKLLPAPKKMIVAKPEKVIEIEKQLRSVFKDSINITRSKPYLIELIHPKVSKANALKILADKYNINQEEVIAIGDNENDIEMVKWAGLGAAVANSSQSLKDCAQYVSNGEYNIGVEEIIKKFLL